MKYFALFLMIFSLCVFTVGCDKAADTNGDTTPEGDADAGDADTGDADAGDADAGDADAGDADAGSGGEPDPTPPNSVD